MTTKSEAISPIKNKKTIAVIAIIGLFILLFGYFYFFVFNSIKKGNEGVSQKASVPVPEKKLDIADSFKTKDQMYDYLDKATTNEQSQMDAFYKGNDAITTNQQDVVKQNLLDQQQLQQRMKNEIASNPTVTYPQSTDNYAQPAVEKQSSEKKISSSFNSFAFSNNDNNLSTEKVMENFDATMNKLKNQVSDEINVMAEIVEKSKVTGGSTMRAKLLENITVNGVEIKAGTVVAGICQDYSNRISFTISSVNVNNKIILLSMKAYDMDGMEGLYVKNAQGKKDVNSGMGESIGNAESVGTSYLGLPGQIGGGVIRGILSSKKKTYLTIPEGYKIILRKI